MYIAKLKVRPRKNKPFNPCVVELTSMLGCWTAKGDLHNAGECAESAKALFECMRSTPARGKIQKSSINFHLARLNKHLK